MQRAKTNVLVVSNNLEMDYVNELADNLSADNSESPLPNSKTVSSKNFTIQSESSEISLQSDSNAGSEISVNQMKPIVFKNLSPEYQKRKLDKQTFNTTNSPTRIKDMSIEQV